MSLAKFFNSLSAVRFTPILLLILAAVSIPGTLLKSAGGYYSSPILLMLYFALITSITICTARRIRYIRLASLLIHSGILIIAAGGLIRFFYGYVATVNIYENSSVNSAFRWDINKDASLPFTLTLDKIGAEFYGTPVKIGVLENGAKKELITSTVGSSFKVSGFDIYIDRLFEKPDSLILKVTYRGKEIAVINTADTSKISKDFPYTFKLVAYKNPELKRSWTEMTLASAEFGIKKGLCEVNSPLRYGSVTVHHVQNGIDESGRLYAGLQFVKDPGRNIAFAGLIIISAGGVLLPFSRKSSGGEIV